MSGHGWLWTDPHIVGSLDAWSTDYHWNGKTYPRRADAIKAGLREYGSDDFNIAHLAHGVVDWFGWMNEPHELYDAREFAATHGFLVASLPEPQEDR